MINLRHYQTKAIDDIRNAWLKSKKHLILQSATGSGKTIIFTYISKLISNQNKKVLIFTNRTELLLQAGGSMKKFGLQSFYIQAGCKVVNKSYNCYVAMSQTFRNRISLEYWKDFLLSIDLIVIDEIHLQDFNFLFESGLIDDKHVIGFTATPKRDGKQRQLALDFDEIINTISIGQLISEGYLVNADNYSFEAPDLSGVGFNAMKGDYYESQMFKQFNSPKLYAGLVKNYIKHVEGTKSIVFCVNIEHAIKTTLEFVKFGYKAKFIVSGVSKPKLNDPNNEGAVSRYNERMKVYDLYIEHFDTLSGDRNYVLDEFDNDKFLILVNASILTTGYDCPSIETVILNRATISLTLYLQMLGRGSRPFDGKTHFNVLDMGGNIKRHGLYDEDRMWHIWHEESKGGGIPPVKDCGFDNKGKPITGNKKGCRRLILAAYSICPFCGFIYPDKKLEEIDLNIVVPEYNGEILAPKNGSFKGMTYDQLYRYYQIKKHKPAWLWRWIWYKGGESALIKFADEKNWQTKTLQNALHYCRTYIKK